SRRRPGPHASSPPPPAPPPATPRPASASPTRSARRARSTPCCGPRPAAARSRSERFSPHARAAHSDGALEGEAHAPELALQLLVVVTRQGGVPAVGDEAV